MLERVSCFVYEADYHCTGCAQQRFGVAIWEAETLDAMQDADGNKIGVLYTWDERPMDEDGNSAGLTCGDCLGVIEEPSDEYLKARKLFTPHMG